MSELVCKNCGSRNFVEENGIPTCKSCGTKYPEFSLDKVGIEEELKNKEIRRLVDANEKGMTFKSSRLIVIIPLLFLGFPLYFIGIYLISSIIITFSGSNIRMSDGIMGTNVYMSTVGPLSLFLFVPLVIIGLFYLLYNRGFFYGGKSDLEPSLNILSDDEVLKYAPKSKAARKIKANQK
ncbi:MAG: TFIIB-type zinc ribbon-containing protein [Methanobacteriaceae archaeon]